ncbi:MAG: hypothetical protein ACKOCK_06155 [Chloroflexota bacterium]
MSALRAFVDTLIPGDDEFPAASAVGVDRLLAERLPMLAGADAIARLELAVGDLSLMTEAQRIAAVAAWQAADPVGFGHARTATYLAYYARPEVVQAIRGLGIAYNDAPQPLGYRLAPWDLRQAPEGDTPSPTLSAFTYKRTAEITRISQTFTPDGEAPE